ncbi:predicted protein [Nematostella vectensis]|uniref:Fanconi anaemia group A protein N-terminal domain-containing protein n=1 Tax=Nematostella vectensis TaxID=45351 RepID=A7S6Y7_NEMVE|nr:predicted protein [Nematostella vectensis]|eukprot:XP_001632575.1 predicted protein [Nematostella vectensis]
MNSRGDGERKRIQSERERTDAFQLLLGCIEMLRHKAKPPLCPIDMLAAEVMSDKLLTTLSSLYQERGITRHLLNSQQKEIVKTTVKIISSLLAESSFNRVHFSKCLSAHGGNSDGKDDGNNGVKDGYECADGGCKDGGYAGVVKGLMGMACCTQDDKVCHKMSSALLEIAHCITEQDQSAQMHILSGKSACSEKITEKRLDVLEIIRCIDNVPRSSLIKFFSSALYHLLYDIPSGVLCHSIRCVMTFHQVCYDIPSGVLCHSISFYTFSSHLPYWRLSNKCFLRKRQVELKVKKNIYRYWTIKASSETQGNVNFGNFFSLISVFIVNSPNAKTLIEGCMNSMITDALASNDEHMIGLAFLVIRQACMEGPHVFKPYSMWFNTLFNDPSMSGLSNKRAVQFFFNFLTKLVPYDPVEYLKVHVIKAPHIPANLRSHLMDYTDLAKTRLMDLKVSISIHFIMRYRQIYNKQLQNKQQEQSYHEVERVIGQFSKTGKVPASVMEARANKIPNSMLAAYHKACRKLAQEHDIQGNDSDEDSQLSCFDKLSKSLSRLPGIVLPQGLSAATGRVSSHLSLVAGYVMKVFTNNEPVSLPSTTPVVIDPYAPCVDSRCLKDGTLLAIGLNKLSCMSGWYVASYRIEWVVLHVRMDGSCLSVHHIHGLAAFLCHMSTQRNLFKPVIVKSNQSHKDTAKHILLRLHPACIRGFCLRHHRQRLPRQRCFGIFTTDYSNAHKRVLLKTNTFQKLLLQSYRERLIRAYSPNSLSPQLRRLYHHMTTTCRYLAASETEKGVDPKVACSTLLNKLLGALNRDAPAVTNNQCCCESGMSVDTDKQTIEDMIHLLKELLPFLSRTHTKPGPGASHHPWLIKQYQERIDHVTHELCVDETSREVLVGAETVSLVELWLHLPPYLIFVDDPLVSPTPDSITCVTRFINTALIVTTYTRNSTEALPNVTDVTLKVPTYTRNSTEVLPSVTEVPLKVPTYLRNSTEVLPNVTDVTLKRSHVTEMCCLQLSVTLHLMKAVFSFDMPRITESPVTASRILQQLMHECPMFLVSLQHYWPQVKATVSTLYDLSSIQAMADEVENLHDFVMSICYKHKSLLTETHQGSPHILGASLYQALRTLDVKPEAFMSRPEKTRDYKQITVCVFACVVAELSVSAIQGRQDEETSTAMEISKKMLELVPECLMVFDKDQHQAFVESLRKLREFIVVRHRDEILPVIFFSIVTGLAENTALKLSSNAGFSRIVIHMENALRDLRKTCLDEGLLRSCGKIFQVDFTIKVSAFIKKYLHCGY